MDEFQGEIDKCVAAKDALAKQIGEQNQKSREMRSQLQDAKKKMNFASEEEIDQEIANIEFKMWTSSLSLKEEKLAVQQIADLKKQKNVISDKMRELRDEKRKEQEAY